jgi:E3 ubiquitin-protein ligase RNF14
LFTWISFLTDELFDYLKLDIDNLVINPTNKSSNTDNEIDKRAIVQPCSSILLKNYDQDQIDFKFQTSYFDCNVCFVSKLGKECFKFNKCEHVFCNECMKGYFESQIKDGNVKSLTCPQDKCTEQAIPAQVCMISKSKIFFILCVFENFYKVK